MTTEQSCANLLPTQDSSTTSVPPAAKYGIPPAKFESMKPEFQARAMFDNYANDTLRANKQVKFYKRLKNYWFLITTVFVYVWGRALFYDKSYSNNC